MVKTPRALRIEHELPCGHTLCMGVFCEHPSGDPQWVVEEAGKLAWWLTTRIPMHKCELVSEENPNGIEPRGK